MTALNPVRVAFADRVVTLHWVRATAMDYTLSYSDMRNQASDDWGFIVPVLTILPACYGDYDNSTAVEMSNHRVILANKYRVVREIVGDFASYGLALTLPRATVRRLRRAGRTASARLALESLAELAELGRLDDERADMLDMIVGLSEYVILDESDHSELEWEMITSDESWDTVKTDMAYAVARAIPGADGSPSWDYREFLTDDSENDPFRAWFGEFLSAQNTYPSVESASGSIAWYGIDDDAAAAIVDSIRTARRFPWLSFRKVYVPADTYTVR